MSSEVDLLMSEFYAPMQGAEVGLAAMVEAMRAQTAAVGRQSEKVDALGATVSNMREDIAAMKARDDQFGTMTALLADLTSRLTAVELRNAEQDGAGKLIKWVRDIGPWVLGIGGAILAAAGKIHIG